MRPTAARRVFLTLTFTRWFPVGLVAGLFILVQTSRGLTVAQAMTASAASGSRVPCSNYRPVASRTP